MGGVRPAGWGCLQLSTLSGSTPGAPGATIALEVEDLVALVDSLKAKGVAVGEFETPVCRMAVIKDPDGNAIILHKLKRDDRTA